MYEYDVDPDDNLADKVLSTLKERGPGLGGIVMLKEPNPLDGNTPLQAPLIIVGMGLGSGNVAYDTLTGWDGIGAEDPYYILRWGDAYHVMRQSHAHTAFYPPHVIEAVLWDTPLPLNT